MPDARTHDMITLATGAALGPLAYGYFSGAGALGHPEAMALTLWLSGAHVVSGVLFSPDLDMDSAIDDRWGICCGWPTSTWWSRECCSAGSGC